MIAGAGHAGLRAVLRLAAKLDRGQGVALTLVDRHDYHQVLTELSRLAGGSRAAEDVRIPLAVVLDGRRGEAGDEGGGVGKVLPRHVVVALEREPPVAAAVGVQQAGEGRRRVEARKEALSIPQSRATNAAATPFPISA